MSYGVNSIQIHKKLRLDKRAGSDNWYARLTLPSGKRLIKTTKTDDLEAAKEVALRLYYEVDARIQNKLPATTRKFKDVARHAILRMEAELEQGVAESHKYKWNMALEAIRNLNDTTNLYGGIGFIYEEEKIEYRLGDWKLEEHSAATTPQLYIGLTYQIFNDILVSRLNCQLSHNLKNEMNVKCGIGIPLN